MESMTSLAKRWAKVPWCENPILEQRILQMAPRVVMRKKCQFFFFFLGTGANYNSRNRKRNQSTKDKGQETKDRTKASDEGGQRWWVSPANEADRRQGGYLEDGGHQGQ